MDSGLVVVSGDLSFPELLNRYTASSQDCFPIVDEQSHLTGVIDANDIRGIVTETGITDLIIARDVARPAATVTGGDSLLAALNKLQQGDTAALIVVDETDERGGVGTLSRGDIIAAYRERIPWGARGRPRDIGNVVAFLASDEARYITGQVIYVDGGYLADSTPEAIRDKSQPVPPDDPDPV